VEGYVEHYNNVRLNSAVGYITPKDMLAGRQREIRAERDKKLEEARKQRQIRRQQDRVKDEEPSFRVASEVDNFRLSRPSARNPPDLVRAA
jgi:putative transposase